MTTKEESKQSTEKNNQTNSMNLALIGGVVGAGIGLLSSPGTSKKVMKSLSESEVMRSAGKELKRTAQEILTEQAINSFRQTASGYMSGGGFLPKKKNEQQDEDQDQDGQQNKSKEEDSSQEQSSSEYDEIKEENKQLNDRLEKIEEMLNNLVESKK
ncbi:GvpT/GvpP family gas vesicle accessory protein [Alkalihalophilus marmarensis]|uniref:GvpT/GvpP family gas vesicle accessory protein n=1 Tax=Alkalihalophilus marmarensis TaxID=521377 RepID=UPI002DBFA159|nr:GvpT/GvpP family gas vesicle accessory protein [Alkalihalophilus marmarensis]MEC2074024.1 gas vesicle protein GvpP [Alkalihalophilus marmarensis]